MNEKQPKSSQDEKPDWVTDEDWQDQQEELAAWRKHRERQRGGPEPTFH